MSTTRTPQGAERSPEQATSGRTPRLDALAPSPESFRSRLRSPAVTARVGLWLGVCFTVAFVTGLYSHLTQTTPDWLTLPTRPASLYRVTQGLHVIAGSAAVPLLLVKLWSVYPKLFERFDVRDVRRLMLQALERLSIALLVTSAIFMLATGLANSAQWYPWSHFSFRATHYAVAWVAVGALAVHVAVKLPLIREALGTSVDASIGPDDERHTTATPGLTRRGLLRTTWLATGVVVLSTAGIAVPLLRKVSVFGVRSGGGPQGIPINKTAYAAQVTSAAQDPDFRLRISNGSRRVELDLDRLRALPQTSATLPIACVEGWSASGHWRGVRMAELLALVEAPEGSDVEVRSLQPSGPYRVTTLPHQFAADPSTLLALELNGEPLSIDHGYPCRLIAPGRPGVLQTKWVGALEVKA